MKPTTTKLIILFLGVLIFCPVFAQVKVDLNKKVNNQVNRRANQKTDQAIDKGLDAVEGGVKDALKKKKDQPESNATSSQNSQQNSQQNQQTNQQKSSTQTTENSAISQQTESQPFQSFSQYDFVPGDQVILFEDFSQDAVGDFPALWTTNKSGEVNTLSIAPGKWLNFNSTEGNWWFLKEINFPDNYIIEYDIVPKKIGGRYAIGMALYSEANYKEMSDPNGGTAGLIINVSKNGWETKGMKSGQPPITGNSNLNPVEPEKNNHVIVWIQKRRVRIYHKGAKVLDMPTNLYDGSKFSRFSFCLYRGASCSSYITNIKITSAAPDLRSKLLTEGKIVSYGIYFDVNRDVVKPESYGTLKSIAQILEENPTVSMKIIGYTDSDGDDAANLDLSKRRGASVKNELVKSFGIAATRLESDGLGEAQPVAPNDSPANKAKNRRVEFIKTNK